MTSLERQPEGKDRISPEVFDGALSLYEVEDDSFSARKDTILRKATEIITDRSIDPSSFLGKPESAINFLAAVDYSSAEGLELPDEVLRHIPLRHSCELASLPPAAASYEMQAAGGRRKISDVDLIADYYSDAASFEELLSFSDWSKNSLLQTIRSELRVTQETERPYVVHVLDLDTNQFFILQGCVAKVKYTPFGSEIFLPSDAEDDTKIHEYIHTQTVSFGLSARSLLYVGLNEGLVDYHVSRPAVYAEQVNVAEYLFSSNIVLYEELMGAITTGNRETAYAILISQYGLSGLSALARMSPVTSEKNKWFYPPDIDLVCIQPEETLEILQENSRY